MFHGCEINRRINNYLLMVEKNGRKMIMYNYITVLYYQIYMIAGCDCIVMDDNEPIILISKIPTLLFKLHNFKLYSKNNIDIYGSFLFINDINANFNKQFANINTYFNIETLSISINNKLYIIDISTLKVNNPNKAIISTNIFTCGETIQREFYISGSDNIIIKIIKNIHKYNNMVKIFNIGKNKINDKKYYNILNKN